MAYDDQYRLSAHAVILNDEGKVLLLKATYGNLSWGLPGGAFEPGETVHESLQRECFEEIGIDVNIIYMSGMYFHKRFNSHVCIFKGEIPKDSEIKLSSEHSEYKYFALDELGDIQRQRVIDCLQFDGKVKSAKF